MSTDQWFRGDVAPFAGVEWQINDKWGLKAEYSSDVYNLEKRQGILTQKSRFNFGAEYQISDSFRLGAYYLYGTEFGLNLQMQINPKRPIAQQRIPAPRPYFIRPSRTENPETYETTWAALEAEASVLVRDAIIPLLKAEGMTLVEVKSSATTTEVRFKSERHRSTAVSVGGVARVMARLLPDSVATFRIVPVVNDLPQSGVVLRRSDLEALEFSPNATGELLAVTGFSGATLQLPGSARNEELFPKFDWSFSPYVWQRLFDPEKPIDAELGLALNLSYQPAPSWKISGSIEHRLTEGSDDDGSTNTSLLEHVRTDGNLYDRAGATSIRNLYVSRQWKTGPDVYARVSAGYLERTFGDVSAEMLWKPVGSRLALGVEANYAKQRVFDSVLGFQDYGVATGHASAYYEFGGGFTGKLDVGRYLAGDVGATVTLEREFANGWRIGGFFTLTDASAEEFGEGSFDKGITISIPTDWLMGKR